MCDHFIYYVRHIFWTSRTSWTPLYFSEFWTWLGVWGKNENEKKILQLLMHNLICFFLYKYRPTLVQNDTKQWLYIIVAIALSIGEALCFDPCTVSLAFALNFVCLLKFWAASITITIYTFAREIWIKNDTYLLNAIRAFDNNIYPLKLKKNL